MLMGMIVIMIVVMTFMVLGCFGRFRSWIIFDCIDRAQRFAFRARRRQTKLLQRAVA